MVLYLSIRFEMPLNLLSKFASVNAEVCFTDSWHVGEVAIRGGMFFGHLS